MKERIIGVFKDLFMGYIKRKKVESEEEKRLKEIKAAHREWLAKEEYFNYATDPDLVDFAIYDLEASRRKYIYLLKKEKNM